MAHRKRKYASEYKQDKIKIKTFIGRKSELKKLEDLTQSN